MGKVSRQEAEAMLLERNEQNNFSQKDGAFLVRNSETGPPGDFSISVKFVLATVLSSTIIKISFTVIIGSCYGV